METIIPVLIVGGFLATFGLVLVVSRKQARRARENLTSLAQQLGLSAPGEPKGLFAGLKSVEIAGLRRGRTVKVWSYSTGSGKNRTSWCALGVSVQNPGKLTLRVSRENVFTRVGRAFGLDDVATGDVAFDEQFYIKSNDAGYIRAALIPEVRAHIVETWKNGARGTISVDGGEIKYAEVGSFSSDKICRRFPAVVDLACMLGDVVEARGA